MDSRRGTITVHPMDSQHEVAHGITMLVRIWYREIGGQDIEATTRWEDDRIVVEIKPRDAPPP